MNTVLSRTIGTRIQHTYVIDEVSNISQKSIAIDLHPTELQGPRPKLAFATIMSLPSKASVGHIIRLQKRMYTKQQHILGQNSQKHI